MTALYFSVKNLNLKSNTVNCMWAKCLKRWFNLILCFKFTKVGKFHFLQCIFSRNFHSVIMFSYFLPPNDFSSSLQWRFSSRAKKGQGRREGTLRPCASHGATRTDVDHYFCHDDDDSKAPLLEQLHNSCTRICIENKSVLQYFNMKIDFGMENC